MPSIKVNDNGDSQEKILKNTSFLTGAFVVQKVISFLYFIFIARRVGPVDLGLYDPIKSLIPITLILIDFSLSAVVTREIARAPERKKEYVSNILGIKILFGLVVMFIAGLATTLGNFDSVTRTLLYIVGMIVVLDTFTLTFFAVFRGLQNLLYESVAIIINQVLTISAGGAALLMGFGLKGLFLATLLGSVFNFTFAFFVLKRKVGINPMPSWDRRIIGSFLKMALPFALAAILAKVFTYTDRYMLLSLAGKQYVGWYITANKLTFALEFIPSAFAASVYPAMSALYVTSKEQLARTFEKSMQYLLIIAIPLSLAVFTLSHRLIVQLYTSVFNPSVTPLRIMILGLFAVFLNYPVGALLNATNRQTKNTINMGITVTVNIILDILLIPRFTFIGAAVSTLISMLLLFSLGMYQAAKVVPYRMKHLLNLLLKSIFCSLIMSGILYMIAPHITFNVTPYIKNFGSYIQILLYYGLLGVIGASIYGGLSVGLKAISIQEIRSLYHSLAKKVS